MPSVPDELRLTRTIRVSAATIAALLVLSGALSACGNKPYVAPTPTAVASIDPGRATETLSRLQSAVRRGDASATRSFGADPAASAQLAAIATNVSRIGLDRIGFTYLTENGGGDLHGAWDADVQVTWRVRGFDREAAQGQVDVAFADGGAKVSRIGGGQDLTPLWLAGAVTVRRTPDTLVIAATSGRVADTLAAEAKVAVARDDEVLGGHRKVVYEAAGSVDEMNRALGADPGTYSGVAAVTAPVDGNRVPGTPVHVFLNPAEFRTMDRTAAQVVMTHESVHAVTGAPLVSGAPLWLIEGFADFVALGDVHLPLSKTARQISAQVRRTGAPKALPADDEFGASDTNLGPTYEAAWLVCVTIADHAGSDAMVRLYNDVLGGTPIARALPRDTGLTVASLTAAWRSKLEAVATATR